MDAFGGSPYNNPLKPTAYASHVICVKANPAPRYGGLVPPVSTEPSYYCFFSKPSVNLAQNKKHLHE